MTKSHLSLSVGDRFTRGVVIETDIRVPYTGRPGGLRGARLQCDCGNIYESAVYYLTGGRTKSCGCWSREHCKVWARSPENLARIAAIRDTDEFRQAASQTKHGLSRHPLYKIWRSMIARCDDPDADDYRNYGGRGIVVCPEFHDVAIFISWVEANLGPRPDGCSIDRIDNDGNYEPGNLRWATWGQQGQNRRTVKLDHDIVQQMRDLRAIGWPFRRIADDFGVTTMCAFHAIRGDTWKPMTQEAVPC